MRTKQEGSIYNPEGELLPKTKLASTLIFDFPVEVGVQARGVLRYVLEKAWIALKSVDRNMNVKGNSGESSESKDLYKMSPSS